MYEISTSLHAGSRESAFVSLARLLMVFALVWHHLYELPGSSVAPRAELQETAHFLPEFVNSFMHMAFLGAIPLLSLLAGYLLYRQRGRGFRLLYKREFFSTILPAWLWATLALALAYGVYRLAGAGGAFAWADYGFTSPGPMTLVDGILGHDRVPLALQFWFVHDLLLTLLLAPVLFYALRRLSWRLPLALLPLWLLLPSFPLYFYSHMPFFFVLGAWLAHEDGPGLEALLDRLQSRAAMLLVLFATAVFARVMAPSFGEWQPALQSYVFLCLIRGLGLLTFAVLIYRLSLRGGRVAAWLLRFRSDAFFVYAAHYPLIEVFQSLVLFMPGHDTSWGFALSWLLIPVLTIASSIALSRYLAARAPTLQQVLDGTWSLRPRQKRRRRLKTGRGAVSTV